MRALLHTGATVRAGVARAGDARRFPTSPPATGSGAR